MRTTVTIDDHLLAEAKVLAARQHRSLSTVVEDALRQALATARRPPSRPLQLTTYGDPRRRPLVDTNDKEALAEVLGDNEWPRADR